MNRNARAGLKDVAKRCGLSYAAVSHILSGKPNYKFKKETVELVLETARELNYRPNQFASSLRKQENQIISCIVGDALRHSDSAHLKQLELELNQRNYNLIVQILIGQPDEVKLDFIRRMINFPAGIALWSLGFQKRESWQTLAELFKNAPPSIMLNSPCPGSNIDYVKILWGSDMLDCLIDFFRKRNYNKVALCSTELESRSDYPGKFMELAAQAGMTAELLYDPFSENDHFLNGRSIAKKLLKRKSLPDAIYCTSDEIAFSLITAFSEQRRNIRDEVYIVGGGDSAFAHWYDPPLPMFVHDIPQLMKTAVDDLIMRIERGDTVTGTGRCVAEITRRLFNA